MGRHKMVNGKRVPLTPEEEKARDKEEEEWKKGEPKRKADQKKAEELREQKLKELQSKLIYKARYVAFLDVLGWKSFVEQSAQDPELAEKMGVTLNLFKSLKEFYKLSNEMLQIDRQISQFSDCLVLSSPVESLISFSHFIQDIKSLIGHYINQGFPIRGGISTGALIHTESILYGPALNKAYQLESEDAIYPRVLFDPIIRLQNTGQRYQNTDGSLIGYDNLWREDKDGLYFLDYLQPLITSPGIENNVTRELTSKLTPVHKLITTSLEKYKSVKKIRKKYEWYANYYNNVVNQYPECNLDKIEYRKYKLFFPFF